MNNQNGKTGKTSIRYCQRMQCEVVIIKHERGIFVCEWSVGYKPTTCTEICVHSKAIQIAAMRASKSPVALGARDYAPEEEQIG